MMVNGITIDDDIARARALGLTIRVSAAQDRYDPADDMGLCEECSGPAGDGRQYCESCVARALAPFNIVRVDRGGPNCPTCDDGYLTINSPRQCRQCQLQRLYGDGAR